ncbi:peptidylprolyl isomerase [Dongia deserti]|uniref:peptidylprolyl isomerase n=1 Tax=Dongia deserti TaxID=2268030 RepID=UPI000E647EF5|nr:peptidylprolyl isomerase [Dongia deserti]
MLMSNATILKPLRRAVVCAVLLLGSMAGSLIMPVQAQDQLRIAAVVNDEIISELDVYMRLRIAMLSAQLQDTEETRRRLLPQVLRNLIDDRLKIQEAKRTGIKINPADVERRIDRLAERNNMTRADLETFLRSNGVLVDAIADQITAELNWARLVQRTLRPRIVITDQEINEEAARIKATQGQTEYKMYQIFLAVDAPNQESPVRDSAERLVEQLRAGADFESLAQEFSQDEGALKGGNWGWMRLDQMEPAVAREIQLVPTGQLVGPLRGTGGYFIAFASETRVSGSGDPTGAGSVTVKQILWSLPPNAAESEVNRAISQANTIAGRIENCGQMAQVAEEASPGVYRELGSVLVNDLPQQVQSIAINQPIDIPSRPVRTNQGVGLYLICARQGGDEDSQSRTAIADRLGQQRLETLARGYLSDLRRAAVIDIRM